MKKLLGIVVLGLLLSGNAYAAKSWLKENNWHKNKYWKTCKEYIPPTTYNQQETWNSVLHQCLKNMEKFGKWRGLNDNPVAIKENKTKPEKIKIIKEIKKNELVIGAKKTCIELGFKEGSEKLADCALKLMTMNSLESETETNVLSSSSSAQDKQYTFTGDATFGNNKQSKKQSKKVAKYMGYPDESLCIGYINNYGIMFKKSRQAARAEAIRLRGLDCSQYRDAAYYDKQRRKSVIADATKEALEKNADAKSEAADRAAKNRSNNVNCTSRKSGSYVRTTCY